jgi:hypothetical protein
MNIECDVTIENNSLRNNHFASYTGPRQPFLYVLLRQHKLALQFLRTRIVT